MPKNKTKQFKENTNRVSFQDILKVFNQHPTKTYNYKQIANPLGIKDKTLKASLITALYDLKAQDRLIEVDKGKFKLKRDTVYAEGIIDFVATGSAYVTADNFKEDIVIPARKTSNAFQGDKVKVLVYSADKDKRAEGEVVEVLERAKSEIVGTVEVSNHFAFLIPSNTKIPVDIFIPLEKLHHAKHGEKAVAQLIEWKKGQKNPTGKIISVLGLPGENNTEMNAILAEYGFPLEFPIIVENEAKHIPTAITKEEIKKRRDFRDITTFTIDPIDAKDFDDALSIQKLPNGNWEVGVHIADVSHFVKPKSVLDEEAFSRATSIYLVDRVIPMLPEKLSNDVCSLRPKEEKLCFSAVFELDEQAHILNQWMGRTVIFSDRRFNYDEVQEILEKTEDRRQKTEDGREVFEFELHTLDKLAKKLREQRFKDGAIAFEKTETKFHLDEHGNPLGVYVKESKDSHKLIEEFMLLANKKVAEFVGKNAKGKRPFVYRIHDAPVADRINTFAQFAKKFGYTILTKSTKEIASSLNSLMRNVSGKKEQNVLEQLAIRTMAKAIYTTENIGHYGLAFDYYTHFTSPIRRYPDVMVHRLLQHYLHQQQGIKDNITTDVKTLEKQCKHSTEMEIKASEAERASIKYKQVQFLENKVGQVFEGLISGVTEWGIYVEIIENKCEGLIHVRSLDDDYYEFDAQNYCLVGRRHKRKHQLGDAVTVKIKSTNLVKKQIDLELVKRGKKEDF